MVAVFHNGDTNGAIPGRNCEGSPAAHIVGAGVKTDAHLSVHGQRSATDSHGWFR